MIKIGIIGMSAGNAHPFSWSSIINGKYDRYLINQLGFPAVTVYLEANYDTLGIPDAEVTHVWTQDRDTSEYIASSAGIQHIVTQAGEMIGQVEAVILARDDAENHVEIARPFIEAGIPIFIDKPLAITQKDLDWFTRQVEDGKFIMSCSSMRYSNECRVVKQELSELGNMELVTAVGKKDWLKYGVHMVEAMFATLDDPKIATVQYAGKPGKDVVHLEFENGLTGTVHLFKEICGVFQVHFYGKKSWRSADIKNSYSMFRDNIIEFIRSVKESRPRLDFARTINVINTVIAAEASRQNGGKIIHVK